MSKRSGANSKSKPPDFFVFFLDRSLGKFKVAEALRSAGVLVRVHSDHFREDEKDEVWLHDVGRRGWVVLAKDQAIRYNAIERRALLSGGVRAFILTSGGLTGDEMAAIFQNALPKMSRLLRKHQGPFIARVTRGADVKIVDRR